MKKIFNPILLSALTLLSVSCNQQGKSTANDSKNSGTKDHGTISISGAFALYPITVKWAEEFKKLHPGVKIDVSAGGAGKGVTDVLSGLTDIGLLSRDLTPEEKDKGGFPIAVTKDAVVPDISVNNPYLKELQTKGVTKEELNDLFITGKIDKWNQLGVSGNSPVHIYTRSDASGAAETWAKYFGKKQEDLKGTAVFGDPGLAQAVQKDPLGIGFNNIVYVYDSKTNKPTNGVVPLPVDLNSNGKIDADENFYSSVDEIDSAIAAGKYPSPPARNLYFLTKGTPTSNLVKEFIKFVLTDGQQYIKPAGYIALPKDSVSTSLSKLK